MQKEDLLYLIVLIVCIPSGYILKLCTTSSIKRFLAGGGGALICLLLLGYEGTAHSFITILGNYVLVKVIGIKHCRWISFIFVFGYLFFFRICSRFGLPEPVKYANAVQLLVTLRMVSLSFELNDFEERDNKDNSDSQMYTWLGSGSSVSIIDFFAYGYCYIGLMTGPFYKFQTFQDMLHQDGRDLSTVMPALRHLKLLPFITIPYIFLQTNFSLDYLRSEEYLNHSWGLAHQLLILVPTFTWFRWRFYIAWILAETMCISAGLGAYPFECEAKPGVGPTKHAPPNLKSEVSNSKSEVSERITNDETHCFKTIHNISIFSVEFSPTMRTAMKEWNMTVQWWMANYVYKKLPIKSSKLKMFILLFVSAFWHGVHPGYYVTFLSVPLVVIAESRMIKLVKPYLGAEYHYWFDWVTWFCLYRSFEYLGIGFMLLELNYILVVWTKMYFIGHLFILLFILLPFIVPKYKEQKEVKEYERESEEFKQK